VVVYGRYRDGAVPPNYIPMKIPTPDQFRNKWLPKKRKREDAIFNRKVMNNLWFVLNGLKKGNTKMAIDDALGDEIEAEISNLLAAIGWSTKFYYNDDTRMIELRSI